MIPLEIVEETGSTSADLKARAEAGGAEAALMARRQTAGTGRMGRVWQAPAGNLSLSVLWRPGTLRFPGHWAILAAVAVHEAVCGAVPGLAGLRLKWPNDLMLDGAKLAGVLIEAGTGMGGPYLVIGIGVNVVAAPEGLGRPLAHLGGAVTAEDLGRRVLASLGAWRVRYEAEGFEPLRIAWMARGHLVGETVRVNSDGRVTEAAFAGLAPDGGLMLDGGAVIRAGEVG